MVYDGPFVHQVNIYIPSIAGIALFASVWMGMDVLC